MVVLKTVAPIIDYIQVERYWFFIILKKKGKKHHSNRDRVKYIVPINFQSSSENAWVIGF